MSATHAPQLPWPYQPVAHLSDRQFLDEVHRRYAQVPRQVFEDPELRNLVMPGLRADFSLLESYRYVENGPLDCPISVFGGESDTTVPLESLASWRAQTRKAFKLRILPGNHPAPESRSGANWPDYYATSRAAEVSSTQARGTGNMAENMQQAGAAEKQPQHREPIAIIGMGCRFAGAPDVESFWRVLRDGLETVGDYPGGRFADLDRVYAPGSTHAGRIASARGGFVEHLDRFDAQFFGISPREAEFLDPQQRLLLEVAWQAVQDAGLAREQIGGSRTGVFVGVWNSDYETCVREALLEPAFHSTTGGGRYAASGRLAYFFDLRGPNLTLDTGCSSSLVAVHLACQSLWSGESDMALAAGANAILHPEITLAYSAAGMLSGDGRCKFGDSSADGYVRSEGAAAVVLKPLSQALADGDPIHALIRGTAVNSCGQSSGFLVTPSGPAQQEVFRAALQCAAVSARDIDYVEAHGTGTIAGDPVEIGASGAGLASAGRDRPCLIGSVQTNIGHTESAAGLAGLVKVALALKHRTIPASLHFREANPNVPWAELPVEVATKSVPWPIGRPAPLAGVNSLGITGTNAHAILESAPAAKDSAHQADSRAQLLTLSAHSPEALRQLAQDWRDGLAKDGLGSVPLADICYTASVRRTHHDFRLVLAVQETGEATRQLTEWLEAGECAGVIEGRRNSEPRKLAFVFPGQGGQWLGMGRGLLRDEPVFRSTMEACDSAIRPFTGWSVIERLTQDGEAGHLHEIDTIQPVLFAFLVSLAEVWRAWGLEPQAVAGHSMGEVAAAVVAGILSLEDGAAVICHRSRLMRRVSGRGLMALTGLNAQDASELASNYPGQISVAACNSPSSTVLSGDTAAVEKLLFDLEARQVFCRRINVDVASHSHQMEPLSWEMTEAVRGIQPRCGTMPLYSTTTDRIEKGTSLNSDHWGRTLRQPVLFASTIEHLLADGFNAFLEIGPASRAVIVDRGNASRRPARSPLRSPGLRRERDERTELLSAVGRLYASGYPVDFARIFPRRRCVSLPNYPFQRERHWLEAGPGRIRPSEGPASRGSQMPPTSSNAADHLYELQWRLAPDLAAAKESIVPGLWVLLDGGTDECNLLAAELEIRGQSCARVYRGKAYRIKAPLQYEADPGCAEDLDRVFAQCAAEAGCPIAGVIHIWGIPGAAGQDSDLSGVWRAQQAGCFSALRVLQALVRWNPAQMPRLWLITADATAPGGQAGFAQGSLWGWGRVVARGASGASLQQCGYWLRLGRRTPLARRVGVRRPMRRPDCRARLRLPGRAIPAQRGGRHSARVCCRRHIPDYRWNRRNWTTRCAMDDRTRRTQHRSGRPSSRI